MTITDEPMFPGVVYRIRLIALFFNLSIIILYFVSYNIISYSLPKILYALVGLCLLGFVTLKFTGRVALIVQNLNLGLMGVLLCLCFLEIIIGIFPSLTPLQVRNFLTPSNIDEIRATSVEFLDQNPYVKFKPNTVVRSQGFRGSDDQFAYEWKTDKKGFKNLPEVAERDQVDIVAVGNSFTEGMGVAVEDTWATKLTEKGYTTYSLGVQGYAPTQCVGSFLKYGMPLNPDYVIMGYTAVTFDREEAYINLEESVEGRKYTGGIQSIVHNEEREIRHRARYFVSAIFLLFQKLVHDYRSTSYADFEGHMLNERYATEIAQVGANDSVVEAIHANSQAWSRALGAFARIKALADSVNARIVLLYFPQRGHVYYEKVTGTPIPEDDFTSIEIAKLRAFCLSNDIVFIDVTKRMVEYVNGLGEDVPIRDYPYLEIDGHLSRIGNRLVAQLVEDRLAGWDGRMQ